MYERNCWCKYRSFQGISGENNVNVANNIHPAVFVWILHISEALALVVILTAGRVISWGNFNGQNIRYWKIWIK